MGFEITVNSIYHADCVELMQSMDENYIDLTVTSPPYDDLRNYKGYSFDFKNIAKGLFRVQKSEALLFGW
jgi:site-specific DNA-methyltransferase (adenine-specific)